MVKQKHDIVIRIQKFRWNGKLHIERWYVCGNFECCAKTKARSTIQKLPCPYNRWKLERLKNHKNGELK